MTRSTGAASAWLVGSCRCRSLEAARPQGSFFARKAEEGQVERVTASRNRPPGFVGVNMRPIVFWHFPVQDVPPVRRFLACPKQGRRQRRPGFSEKTAAVGPPGRRLRQSAAAGASRRAGSARRYQSSGGQGRARRTRGPRWAGRWPRDTEQHRRNKALALARLPRPAAELSASSTNTKSTVRCFFEHGGARVTNLSACCRTERGTGSRARGSAALPRMRRAHGIAGAA